MDFPVFGQNVGVAAAVQTAQLPPASAASAAAAAGPPAARPGGAPSGFLELARQIQSRGESADAAQPRHSFINAAFGDDGFGFDDVIDAINPLQHIPIVSTIYRALTGDKIDAAPRLVGGALYGGFFGLMSEALNLAVEDSTGHDIGDTVRLALFGNPSDTEREPVLFAGAKDPGPAANVTSTAAALPAPGTSGPATASVAADSADSAAAPQAVVEAAATAPFGGAGNGKMPTLTPAQLSLLQERESTDGDLTPASGPVESPNQRPAPPKPGDVIDLSPAQEALLLKSLGIAPSGKTGPGNETGPAVAAEPVQPVQSAPIAPPQGAGNAGETGAAPAAGAAMPADAPSLPKTGTQAAFAKKMQAGLDRYYAHRMPINTRPPHPDTIQSFQSYGNPSGQ